MKNYFYLYIGLVGLMITCVLGSCTNEYEYEPAAAATSGAFLLNADETSFMFLPGEDQSFTITVQRHDTISAGSVKLVSSKSKFNVPTEVSFAANEKVKEVTVTSNLETGSQEEVTINVAPEDAYAYGINALTFSISTPLKYTGVFVSKAFGSYWNQDVYELGGGSYMFPDLYAEGAAVTFVINFTTNKITVAQQAAWVHANYGQAYVSGSGVYDPTAKTATVNLKHSVSAGSFGTFAETFYFPEDFTPAN